jgi:transposase InsO family protein
MKQRSRIFLGAAICDRGSCRRIAQSGGQLAFSRAENAHMESFFHSLKADVIHGRSFPTVTELRQQLRRYVRYYNYQRLHSALDYRSPVDYEDTAA